ncbi:MAG TPA: TolC family protein [Prolixibacteraceae bacterium]|nr:TolC family protein [Prolixibacteraceae bacterium]HPS12047.1 TolC family protein [Prolixibacteraceae bacterium]
MRKIFTLLLVGTLFIQAQAQEKWSLQKCIDYALANNITIKQYEVSTEYQQNELKQAKNNRLPNLNASVSQSLSFGRSQQSDGTYKALNTSTTDFSIGASATLFNGGRLNNNIVNLDYTFKKSIEDLQKAKDDVTLNIASGFLEILFAKELIKAAEAQIDQTQKQVERTKQLVDAGKVAEGTLLELYAQEAREELDLVTKQNSLQIALMNLSQLLELDSYSGFDVEIPELPEIKAQSSVTNASSVYEKAVLNRPEIRSADYQLKSAEAQLKVAKSGLYPSLSASAGFGDPYYNVLNVTEDDFGTQLKNNTSKYLGLSLDIPIFNKFQNRTNIENSKLQIRNYQLQLESTKKELRKQIEQAYTNAVAAQKKFSANMVAVKSMTESFRYIEEKYSVGKVNSVEYNDAKSKLAIAESDLIQAKYEFIFRSKILDFYNGIPIQL